VLKSVGSNWSLSALQVVALMVLSPFVVYALGAEVNGVWTAIISLTGFLQLMVLGIPMASVRYIAREVARDDVAAANRAISTCLAICLAMGFGVVLVGCALYFVFDSPLYLQNPDWNIDAATRHNARLAFAVVLASIAIGFSAKLPYGIYDAHLSFVRRNLVMGAGLLLKLGLTVALLSYDATLLNMAIVLVACMLFEFWLATFVLKRQHPEIRFSLALLDRKLVRAILSFSVFAMLLNVGSKLAFQADALVIGYFGRPADITIYDVGFKVFDPLTNIILAIGMVVMPLATTLKSKGRQDELAQIFEKWSKVAFSIVLAVGGYLLVLGPEFLNWWYGRSGVDVSASGPLLQILMVSFLFFLPARGVALPILMGLGKQHRPALALLAMGIINVVLSIVLIGPYGLQGVALGTAIPNVLFAGALLWLACRELKLCPLALIKYAIGKSALGVLPPLALLLACKFGLHVTGFWPLFLSGLAYISLFGVLWVFFVFKGDRHVDLHALLRRRLAARKGS
jgi:O-antigen/teichoic acid export membrane protein